MASQYSFTAGQPRRTSHVLGSSYFPRYLQLGRLSGGVTGGGGAAMLAARLGKGINYQLLGMCGPGHVRFFPNLSETEWETQGVRDWVWECGRIWSDHGSDVANLRHVTILLPGRACFLVSRLDRLVSSVKCHTYVKCLRPLDAWAHWAQARRGELLRDPQASATSHAGES